jgi:hypothetical protein
MMEIYVNEISSDIGFRTNPDISLFKLANWLSDWVSNDLIIEFLRLCFGYLNRFATCHVSFDDLIIVRNVFGETNDH